MAATWLGKVRRLVASCESTSDEAARWAGEGAPHGAVVVAREQTAGRGRHGRRWQTPPGRDLLMSCVLRPALAPHRAPAIALAAGIAVCDAVSSYGATASLKWPNDVLAGGGKLAGILTEMSTRGDHIEHVILGIGINVNSAREELPAELAAIATSIRIESGREVALDDIEARLCGELEPWIERYVAGGVAAIRDAWQSRARLDRPVRAGGVEGKAVGIDDTGALIVIDAAGRRHVVSAGDVSER